jgi:hypothetical protein
MEIAVWVAVLLLDKGKGSVIIWQVIKMVSEGMQHFIVTLWSLEKERGGPVILVAAIACHTSLILWSLNFLQAGVCYEGSCSTEMKLSFFAIYKECQVYFYHHTSHEHTRWQNSVLLFSLHHRGCDPQLAYLAFRTGGADMPSCCASWDIKP